MKLRRWCKRVLLGVLSAGSGMIIAACYGPVDDGSGWEIVSGRVTASQGGAAIPGLEVCARFERRSQCTSGGTGTDGGYLISGDQSMYDEARNNGFEITVTDTDGALNGSYATRTVTVPPQTTMPVSMDLTVDTQAN